MDLVAELAMTVVAIEIRSMLPLEYRRRGVVE